MMIFIFVVLFYFVELIDQLFGSWLDVNGIRLLKIDGLWGVIFVLFLYVNWYYLMVNIILLLVLGFFMMLVGLFWFVWVIVIIWILGGLGIWLIGNVGSSCGLIDYIGVFGLIFGWLVFLLVFGFFVCKGWDIVIGLVVLFVYGGILFGVMLVLGQCGGVLWQGYLSGVVVGVVVVYLLFVLECKVCVLKRVGVCFGYLKL